MDINFIELHTIDGNLYKIFGREILEFNIQSKKERIDMSKFSDEDLYMDIVDSMLLVINKTQIFSSNNPYILFDDDNITKIKVHKTNGDEVTYFVSFSDYDFNRGQLVSEEKDKTYISIEDTYEKK